MVKTRAVTARRRSVQIDPFDDRPWDMTDIIVEPRFRQTMRPLSVVSLLSWSTLGALALVGATHLPWYRAAGFSSGSRFTLQDHFLSVGTPGTAPGTTAWGNLIARGALGL